MKTITTIAEFRKAVKEQFPHVTIHIKTVSFADLARCSKKCLNVKNEKAGELKVINDMARAIGILPDTNIRFYPAAKNPFPICS